METDPEIIEKEDKEVGTEELKYSSQEIQTDKISEQNENTPEEKQRQVISHTSKIARHVNAKNTSSSANINDTSKNDFPCQIKRVLFSKNQSSDSENERKKSLPPKGNFTQRQIIEKSEKFQIPKPHANTSRVESLKQEIFNLEHKDEGNSEDEHDEEDIRFSIHGESSVDESSEIDIIAEEPGKTKSNSIRIPEFKISKTYDKRSSSHNFRYI